MFFVEKTAPNAPEKFQNIKEFKQTFVQSAFISRAIKPVTNRMRFQCALKCDRLQEPLPISANSYPPTLIFFKQKYYLRVAGMLIKVSAFINMGSKICAMALHIFLLRKFYFNRHTFGFRYSFFSFINIFSKRIKLSWKQLIFSTLSLSRIFIALPNSAVEKSFFEIIVCNEDY